jgi:hypothetical protein
LKVDLASLEQEALTSRPELREQDYQSRISAAETRKAMLRLLPGLEFSAAGITTATRSWWSRAGPTTA